MMLRSLFRKPTQPDPLAVTYGVIDSLIDVATAQRDMTSVGKLRELKKTVGRVSMRSALRAGA